MWLISNPHREQFLSSQHKIFSGVHVATLSELPNLQKRTETLSIRANIQECFCISLLLVLPQIKCTIFTCWTMKLVKNLQMHTGGGTKSIEIRRTANINQQKHKKCQLTCICCKQVFTSTVIHETHGWIQGTWHVTSVRYNYRNAICIKD